MKKLTKKEHDEVVTKGYLQDVLNDRFDGFKKEMFTEISTQTGVMVEVIRHEMKMGFELMNMRFEKLENKMDAMNSRMSASEIWLSNHEDRVRVLEGGK